MAVTERNLSKHRTALLYYLSIIWNFYPDRTKSGENRPSRYLRPSIIYECHCSDFLITRKR
jgi:hypothetical protein